MTAELKPVDVTEFDGETCETFDLGLGLRLLRYSNGEVTLHDTGATPPQRIFLSPADLASFRALTAGGAQ